MRSGCAEMDRFAAHHQPVGADMSETIASAVTGSAANTRGEGSRRSTGGRTNKSGTAEDRFRSLLEAAPDAMVIVDDTGTIRLVNAQTEALFGYRRDELLGHPVEMLIPGRFHAQHAGHRDGYTATRQVRPMGAGL